MLSELGYSFGSKERLGIYLTNTIADLPAQQAAFAFAQAIAEEGKQANRVKQSDPVMVVIGNPPYSGHSSNKGEWIADLVEDYKRGIPELKKPGQAKWLQDDYVKFIRFGQWRINRTGEGVLALITNNGYLDNPTFRGMRQSLLSEFDTIYILNLHGNSIKKERTPDDRVDENVFDIRQGVAISLFIKTARTSSTSAATVYYSDLWGDRTSKYHALIEQEVTTTSWQQVSPSSPFYLLMPQNVDLREEYDQEWSIRDIMNQNGDPAPGIVTTQDQFAISWSAAEAQSKIERFLQTHSEDEARQIWRLCSQEQWNYDRAKKGLLSGEWRSKVIPLLYRPFDIRWTIFDSNVAVHRRERVMQHMVDRINLGMSISRSVRGEPWRDAIVTDSVIEFGVVATRPGNSAPLFPLYLYPSTGHNTKRQTSILDDEPGTGLDGRRPNLAPAFITDVTAKLSLQFLSDGKGNLQQTWGPEDIFHYAYAIFHSPTYRSRYAEFLKIDFPRLPLTSDRDLFAALVTKGAQLVDLHLLRLSGSGGVGGVGGDAILDSPGKQGVTYPFPGTNIIEKIQYHAPLDEAPGYIAINDTQRFVGIDLQTWDMHIGGYQPLEKWLKDRKGRKLSSQDVQHYLRMVIALRETQRIMVEIDELIPTWPIT